MPQSLIFGQVRQIYVADELISEPKPGRIKVEAERVAALARLGAGEYLTQAGVVAQGRPQ